MYGQREVRKENYPFQDIVDSTGSTVKETGPDISRKIQKYTGKTEHLHEKLLRSNRRSRRNTRIL